MSTIKHTLNPERQYVIGTAGHIDHGKTALVKALTGVDTDRLPEEKERGITIDLGFAHLSNNVTIIDVPGHERLIKNMVSGVSTIDLVLFVVAADDGVMPQTREHLDIINLLGIRHGIFVITKIDLVDEEWLALVEEDVENLVQQTNLDDSSIFKTSVETGHGIEELHQAILHTLSEIPPKKDFEIFREPVDRVFSMKGFGTVITGTVLCGSLKTGGQVEIQPGGLTARVRTLQSHDREVQQVSIGYRAAVNLAGIELNQIHRGDVLVQPNIFKPVQILNARLALLKSSPKPLKNNQRIRLHIHTAEVLARVIVIEASEIKPGTDGYVQFRLEQTIHAAYQDRFIIRQYSPQLTIGGGIILQTNPLRFRKKYQEKIVRNLKMLESDDYRSKILAGFDDVSNQPHTQMEIKTSTNIPMKELKSLLDTLISQKEIFTRRLGNDVFYFSIDQVNAALRRIEKELATYHETYPNRPGPSETELSGKLENIFPPGLLQIAIEHGIVTRKIARENQNIRRSDFQPIFSAKESKLYREIAEHYRRAKFTPPTIKETLQHFNISPKEFKEITSLLGKEGELVYLDETLFIHRDALVEIEDKVKTFFQEKDTITVPEFKELFGVTRKHAIPLLIYLDNKDITERDGDVRRRGRVID